jgi:hypothetical protein
MLNSFFLQGANTEQSLVQDLVNEQLKIYGVEVYYLPRQIFAEGKVIRDVIYSKFKNAFPIEAYIMNYEGFDANSVLMSKFGVKVTDEMTLIISRERFELYISEFMKNIPNVKSGLRPNEGDLIYVPMTDSLLEIKYAENSKPFYQLQKNYIYELRCEVYELEDDQIQTGVKPIDSQLKDLGYTALLTLSGIGSTATAYTSIVSGGIQTIEIIDEGYGFTSTPSIVIESPVSGIQAQAIGIMTESRSLLSRKSLQKVLLTNPGTGYTSTDLPTVSFFGGGGYGIRVLPTISPSGGIGVVTLTSPGSGYYSPPSVTFSSPVGGGITATGEAVLNPTGGLFEIRITNAGAGYTVAPTITIGAGSSVASGNFIFGENVTSSITEVTGIVQNWDPYTKQLKVSGIGTDFIPGEIITGESSSATYIIKEYVTPTSSTVYDDNKVIEEEADEILDFSELNPFGEA